MSTKKLSDEEKEYAALLENVRGLLATRGGKDVFWYILSLADVYGIQFNGDNTTFFNEGRRSVGVDVLALMADADPTAYARLLLDKQKQKDGKDE